MDKFYVIRLINRANGVRGFVCDLDEGIKVSSELTDKVMRFTSDEAAKVFIREHRLGRKKISAFVESNEDIINKKLGGTPMDKPMWAIEEENTARKIFFSSNKGYYLDSPTVGFCVWQEEKHAADIIEVLNGLGMENKLFPKKINEHAL